MTSEEPAFKIKNGNLSVLQLHICTTDTVQLEKQLEFRLKQTPGFFSNTPVVLELSMIAESGASLDFAHLLSFMQKQGMCAAGVVGGSTQQREAAVQAGLGLFSDAPVRNAAKKDKEPLPSVATPSAEAVLRVQSELPGFAAEIERSPVEPGVHDDVHGDDKESARPSPQIPATLRPTMVIDKPVRTGQSIYAEGANLVVLGIVNAGAELIADGDIHVYAPMRGKAIAGAHGNESARIFVNGMEAELLSIAGCFKLFEDGIPENVRGKPTQVSLDGSRLVLQPLLR